MKSMNDKFILRDGVEIPCVGFGTWQTPSGDVAISSVKKAIQCGYRHIDAAAVYANEPDVGEALKTCGVERKELFVTSKVWNTQRGYDRTINACRKTLSDLKLEYLDLYLIHWPAAKGPEKEWQSTNNDTWRGMEQLVKEGLARTIGVSNFMPHHLEPLINSAAILPTVNQIEYHPGQMQKETVEYCNTHKILIEAWSPLGTGKMLQNEKLRSIAQKYDVSVARLCIRWCLQNNALPLPKSVTPPRIEENARVFDFEINAQDMKTINEMEYFGGSGLHPDEIDF